MLSTHLVPRPASDHRRELADGAAARLPNLERPGAARSLVTTHHPYGGATASVLANIKGRSICGEGLEITDRQVNFRPLCPGAGWRDASAGESVAHWRRTGRRGHSHREDEPATVPKEQLALQVSA